MALNVPVLIGVCLFYGLIILAGLWAAKATKKRRSAAASDTVIVGARDIGVMLGIWTMTATWVGGGALNGTAETIYDPQFGLVWTIAPVTYGMSLVLNGIFFVKKMRESNYVTLLDPLQAKLGKYFGVTFYLIELTCAVTYCAAILNALGGTIEVVGGLTRVPSVVISAAVAAIYTFIGGLYSVAYTDVLQLFLMITGLLFAIPFAVNNEAVTSITETFEGRWSGVWDQELTGVYVDTCLVTLLGAIPAQVVQQRVLSADSVKTARITCIVGGIFASSFTVPPLILGAVGASTNWTMTDYTNGTDTPADRGEEMLILPLVLQYLTPTAVGVLGLGSVTAAVMSSIDGEFLANASLFGKNIYKDILRPSASEKEVVWTIRATVLVMALFSATIAVSVNSVMALYMVCVDMFYVLTLPQFVSVMYLNPNVYGSIAGMSLGMILRVGGGDFFLGWPAPFNYVSNLPFKTVAMLSCFAATNMISYLAQFLFANGHLPARYDVLKGNLAQGGRTRYFRRQTSGGKLEMTGIQQNKNKLDYKEGDLQ